MYHQYKRPAEDKCLSSAGLVECMVRKRMKNQKTSFAKPVNQLVTACFAVTFLVVYILSIVILLLIVDDMKKYYTGAAILLVIYLIPMIAASLFVTRKINTMFAPVDRASYLMLKDRTTEGGERDLRLLAESLREQTEHIRDISRELSDAREDLDNAFRENRLSREGAKLQSEKYLNEVKSLGDRQESISEISSRMEKNLEQTLPLQDKINQKKDLVYEETKKLTATLGKNDRLKEENETAFERMNEGFDRLDGVTESGNALLESMYNEMTLLQSVASQLNLYAMNTSLDMARAGVINIQVSGALDEIKQLSSKMSEKTDEVMLQVIQIRNILRLTKDETDECRDYGRDCRENNARLDTGLENAAECINRLVQNNEDMANDIAALTNGIYDLMLLEQKRTREERKMAESLKEYGDAVKDKA